MTKNFTKISLMIAILFAVTTTFAQDCATQPFRYTDYVVSGNFTQNNANDDVINDVVMLSKNTSSLRIDALVSNGNGDRTLKLGSSSINYNLDNVNGRMVKGDFDNDGHIDDFILINKTSAYGMRFDLFKSDGNNPSFSQSSVYTLNGYDPDKITGRVVSGDFDQDGYWDDIAAFYDYGNGETRIHTFRSNGSTFVYSGSPGWWKSTGYSASRVTDRVVSGDFDHDGNVDDIAAFYDYGGGHTRIHVWISNGSSLSYQYSTGWWSSNGYVASKISTRVMSLNIDRDGHNYDDIVAFYDYNGVTKMHVFESNGSSFDFSGPGGWWSGSQVIGYIPEPDYAHRMNGKIVEYDSRTSGITQGKPSDMIGFHDTMIPKYRFWRAKRAIYLQNRIEHTTIRYCDSKNNETTEFEATASSLQPLIKAYPNPTKSAVAIEIPEELLGGATRIEVHNLYGNLVFSEEMTTATTIINLGTKNPGVYLVKVIGSTTTNILKVIKE